MFTVLKVSERNCTYIYETSTLVESDFISTYNSRHSVDNFHIPINLFTLCTFLIFIKPSNYSSEIKILKINKLC